MNFGFAHETFLIIPGKIRTLNQYESVTVVPQLKAVFLYISKRGIEQNYEILGTKLKVQHYRGR
jgi:hypothetical protein